MKAIEVSFPNEWPCIYLNNLVEVIKRYVELNKLLDKAIARAKNDAEKQKLAAMKINIKPFWAACKVNLGDHEWDYDNLIEVKVPSRVFNALEAVCVRIAGHVWWYRDASMQAHRGKMGYGSRQQMKRFATSSLVGKFTTPDVGRAMINDGNDEYNDNKWFSQVELEDGSIVVRLHYKTGPNGETLEASDEPRSVCDRVGFVLGSIRKLFGYGGSMRMLMSDITVRKRLQLEWPSAVVDFQGENLTINGNVHGEIIFLTHHNESDGGFVGNLSYTKDPTEGDTPAVLITETVATRCTRTGRLLPIMEKGEVYRYSESTGVAYLLKFEEPKEESKLRLLTRKAVAALFLSVRGFFLNLAFKKRRKELQRVREADARVGQAQAESRERETMLRRVTNPPNDLVHSQIMASIKDPGCRDGFHDQVLECAVLFLDMVGFTSASEGKTGLITGARVFHETVREICFKHGAFTIKAIGDGIMVTFAKGYAGDLRNMTLSQVIVQAIEAAKEVRRVVCSTIKTPGTNTYVKLRLGINAGKSEFGMINDVVDVIGETVNFAARAESAAKTGQILILDQARELLVTKEEMVINPGLEERKVQMAGGMIWQDEGIIQVKAQKVKAWGLLEVTNTEDKRVLDSLPAEGRADRATSVIFRIIQGGNKS